MANATLTFYTISNDEDSNPTETILHTSINGEMQEDRGTQKVVNGMITNEIIKRFIFFPSDWLADLNDGMKVVSSVGKTMILDYVNEYDTHQELHLRERN